MDFVADFSGRPFAVIKIGIDGSVAAFGMSAATAGGANEKLTRPPEDIDRFAVRPSDDVADIGPVRSTHRATGGIRGGLIVLVHVPDAGNEFAGSGVELG